MAAKRLFDLIVAAIALILAIPLFAVLSGGVLASLGRPILFRQRRLGLHQREFELVKFRSMRDSRDAEGMLLPDAARVTRFGLLLRRLRMDELPELWQILRGEMSWVGPRPLPPSVIGDDRLSALRHRIRPGLTGLSQVSGNTLLSQREKVAIDLLYNDTQSFAGDLSILVKTVRVVLRGERRDEPLIGKALAHAEHLDRCG
jgi:lipopolysaccharide/colanic/teichoic acid biosynthesis glycosyltransferase